MLFRGRSARNLDAKGRLVLPSGFREVLDSRGAGGRVVLTTFDGCLMGFPLPDWEEFEQQVSNLPNMTKGLRGFRRLVIGGAEELQLDKMGRLRPSQAQLEYAGISKDVLVVGELQKFELWDPARFEGEIEQDMSNVAEELAALNERIIF